MRLIHRNVKISNFAYDSTCLLISVSVFHKRLTKNSECTSGTYGVHCKYSCGTCVNKLCKRQDGHCTYCCFGGFKGDCCQLPGILTLDCIISCQLSGILHVTLSVFNFEEHTVANNLHIPPIGRHYVWETVRYIIIN